MAVNILTSLFHITIVFLNKIEKEFSRLSPLIVLFSESDFFKAFELHKFNFYK